MLSVHVHLQMFVIAKVRFIFGHILYCTQDNQYSINQWVSCPWWVGRVLCKRECFWCVKVA